MSARDLLHATRLSCCRSCCYCRPHVATFFGVSGSPLAQGQQKSSGGYDIVITSCTSQSSAAMVTMWELRVSFSHLTWCRCCEAWRIELDCACKLNIHSDYLPRCIRCRNFIGDISMPMEIDPTGYFSSAILCQCPFRTTKSLQQNCISQLYFSYTFICSFYCNVHIINLHSRVLSACQYVTFF